MNKLIFFDSTLRDGSHAVKHQIPAEHIEKYCRAVDGSGLHTVVVGHGNGLGASSLQVGLSALTDREMLSTARKNLLKTKLGAFMIPGFGTINDNMIPAIEAGVELFIIGTHCTEADVTKQHISFARQQGKEAYGVLMMYHMATPERLLEEALKMQEYGAMGVILMDSAGASTLDMARRAVSALVNKLQIKVGFHSHNNLGLAVATSREAIQEGATIIDGTVRGFGAGAGNCPLEVLCALLTKEKIETGLNLYKLLDASDGIVCEMAGSRKGLDSLNVVSGMAGIFSAFATQVNAAAKRYNVDPRDIFIELGERKAVGGQEDMVTEVAIALAKKDKQNQMLSF
ncbi:MAG TPA: 4-hydroxy-2-oxovalerate aldolase [Candidatus Goldiibacteriota bacterium]|nr:4-hydroxy-2-oxovalerate aldolase [Candidatus Goldiibacteriota bacterium]HRQ44155.1 4-hydroxy-2-oxovalerate aldolase [Candidatus Goldiibacteriota bacterium]